MNIIKNILPIAIALIPQIIFENYTYVLISIIIIGFISGWFLNDKKIFLKALILQLVFFTILYCITNKNISYLNNVAENLGMPAFIIPVIFILFNTLNFSILFSFGYRLQKLTFNNSLL
ncbi:hypothetical protein LX97_02354 [Nonlabens dokdonensis]|uniref:Uncharacterized protein n=1 Tax=Nonlabens dokdonensis TaxID=328515 RepID=A0ABX5PVY4_9FLAO|nr:hypothetical protein LX97_02354 [Nonlabens dokdonensis]